MYSNLSKEELERIAQQARAKALADYAQNAELNKAHVEKIANVQAQREAGLINDNLADALSYGAKTGVNQMTSGIKSGVMGLQHTGAEMLGMQDAANSLAQKLQQNAQQQAQRQAEINAQYNAPFGMLAQGVADVTSGVIGMLPTVGAFALTPQGKIAAAGKAAQVGAKALGFAPMGLQAGGGGINQALNEGADIGQAKAYGLGTAVKEVATELPFAGIAKVPGIANVGQKLAGGNRFVGGAINAGLEGAEEAMAEAADPYIQRATYNPNAENASAEDMLYSALIGAATAGAINSSLAGAGKVANMAMNTKNQPKNAQNVPKNEQKIANTPQNVQNGSEQVQGNSMTNTLPRPNNGSQNGFIEAEKMRNQLLEEQQRLAKEKSALWQQQQQIKQQDRENAEREMKRAEETLNILKSAKSNAFNDALFNAMDEYTTPEVKQPQPQLSQKELADAKYKLKKLKEVHALVKRYKKRGWLSEREYSDLDSAANASLGISGMDAQYRFTEYYEEEIAKLEELISGKKQKIDKLEFGLPMAERTLENVKNKKVKAYQQENPEIKPFQQETAEKLLFDLQSGEKGRREVGIDAETRNVTTMHGVKRNQSEPINRMLNDGLTYDKIEDGLNRIIEDNGKENTTNAKRVELYVHDAMKDGYNSITSGRVGANNNYAISKMSAEELKAEADRLSAELATTTDEFRLEEISAQLDNVQNRLDRFEQDRAKQEEQKQLAEAYGSLLPNMSDYESMSAEELHNERDKLESASLYAPDDMSAEMIKRFDYLEKLEDGRVNEFIENENMKPHIANAEKKLAEKKLEFEAPRASEALKANQQKMQELEAKQAANSIFSKVNYNEDGTIDLESSILKTPSTAQRTYADYDLSKLKPEVRDFYEMVSKAGKRFGFNIRVVDGIENDANGRYDGKGNILLDGKKMINEKTISRVIGHEVYHYLKDTDEHKLIIDLSLKGKDKTKEIIKKYNEYASHGVYYVKADGTMDTKALLDEIGAEFMEKILSDPQVAEQIWNTNPTLAERIMRFLQDVINQIRGRAKSDVNRKALEAYQRGLRNMQYKQQGIGGTMYSLHDSDKAYMDAVNSGDMETAQRMLDEAAVKAGARHTPSGKPIYFYHGTGADFTVFDEYAPVKHGRVLGAGFYLTAKKDLAERYSSGRLMKNYVMTENYAKSGDMNITKDQVRAFISKMKSLRHDWYTSDIFDLYKYKEEDIDYAEKLANKYDGWPDTSILVDLSKRFAEYNDEDTSYDFSNIAYEIFGYKGLLSSGELVLWDNRLIKSADTVTYDDDGNVIPLSQRFDATNPDIRYNLPNTDTAGRELSKEQAEYFKNSKVRDENGRLKVMYHGTSSHGFNVFDYGKSKFGLFGNGFYFTDNESVAESYTQKGNGDSKGVYKVYLNITNPINMDAPANTEWKSIYLDGDDITAYLEISDGKQPTNEDYFKALKNYCQDSGMYRYEAEEYIQDVILGMGFDGITHIGGGRYNKKDETRHRVYIAFEQEQIKDITNKKPTVDPDIRYSLPSDKEYLDAVNRGDMRFAQDAVNKMAELEGYTVKGYHGTVSDFTVFDINKADAEGNWGKGFYFTTSYDDVWGNYANENGPDLTRRIERLAEQMEWEPEYKWMEWDERYEIAKQKLAPDEPRVIHAALRMENPVEFGGDNETFFDYEEEYDEEAEEYTGETSGLLQEFIDELQDELWDRDIDPSKFEIWSILENAYDGGLYASDLEEKARDVLMYIVDYSYSDEGISAGEILSSTFDRMGFDGIIDHNVSKKFNMDGLYGDTTHYIVFSSTQIKDTSPVTYDDNGNVIPLSMRFDGNNKDIRYSIKDKVDEYGAIPKGENPNGTNRDIDVPQQTADDNRVSRFARTAVESSNVDDTSVSMVMADMENGRFTYEPSGNQEQIDKAYAQINHSGYEQKLNDFQSKYRSGQAMTADDIVLGEALILEAQNHGDYQTAVDLIADVAAIGTELGKAVQALSVLKRLTPQGKVQALKRLEQRINAGLIEQGQNPVKLNDGLLEEMLQAESEQMQSDIWDACIEDMANQTPATLADKINAWRYLAMLSNPKTHIRNIVGNSVMRGVSAVKRGVQKQLENRLLTAGEERYTELNRNVPQEYFDFAKWSWDNHGKYEAKAGGGRYNDAIGQIEQNKRIFNNDMLETARKTNTELLDNEDMWFKEKTYVESLARYMYSNGLSPNALQGSASNATYEKGKQYALKEAYKGTFQEASKVANLLAQMENSSPAMKVVMGALVPFKKTPINILKRGVEYSPVGLLNGLYKMSHDVETGKMTKAEAIDAISAGLTGTGIMVLGYFMASLGMISGGAGEDDTKKQWYDQQMGSQNYALKLPNGGTATIDWLAPSVMPLMAGAELYKQITSENPANAHSSAVTNALEAIAKVANPVLEMSMLQGVTDALESYNSGTSGVLSDLLASTATSYGGQFIPAPVGALARTVDDTVRSSYAPKDSMLTKTGEKFVRQQMNKLPFASMANNPSLDVWGNEIERAGGNIIGRAFNNFINPSTYSADKRTELDRELERLHKATGNSGVIPASGTNTISESNSNPTVYLSHDEYFQYGNTRGQKSYQYVNRFVNSAAYAEMADEDKAEIISDLYSLANYQAKKEALNGRGYNYTNSTYEKVLKSGMEAQNYYIVKYNLDGIADSVSAGQKQHQIAYLKDLQKDGTISDEQCWYLRRAIIGKFSKAEMASCPYAWIKNL